MFRCRLPSLLYFTLIILNNTRGNVFQFINSNNNDRSFAHKSKPIDVVIVAYFLRAQAIENEGWG